jgi:putative flippase GtrA
VVNTLFGLSAYWLLWLGLDRYLAQLLSSIVGSLFNYLTYSRHVFRDAPPAKLRFTLSYIGNYLMGLATLALVSQVIKSAYVAGFVSAFLVSIVNYFVLKRLVFKATAS